jgi:hypothetical protein
LIVLIKVLVGFNALMGSVIGDDLVRAQGDLGHAEPHWTPALGSLRTFTDRGRRTQTLIGKEDLIPAEADRFVFKLAPYLVLLPALITFSIVPVGGTMHIAGHVSAIADGEPSDGHLGHARDVGDFGLRRHAGGLVVGFEVPAAVLGARERPDDQLRSGPRHDHRDRRS